MLVIDDDQEVAAVLAGSLERDGIEVAIALAGQAGLALARQTPFDAIVLDLTMPDMDGVEVLKRLRLDGQTTPVMVLTGHPTLESARQVGVWAGTAYREKPLYGPSFVAVVREVIATSAGASTSRPAARSPVADGTACLEALAAPTLTAPFVEDARRRALLALARLLADGSTSLPLFTAACRAFRRVRDATAGDLPGLSPRLAAALRAATAPVEVRDARLQQLLVAISSDPHGSRGRLTTEQLAIAWGLTRHAAAALIHSQLSMGLPELLRLARVRSVLPRLLAEAEQVAQIAYGAGYEHPSQLDRDLRRLLGVTPQSLRSL